MTLKIKVLALLLSFTLTSSRQAEKESSSKPYEASWASLIQHRPPQWLLDAKFGIYAHWGVYSVPAYGNEWYGKEMYDKENYRNVYQHHMKVYGGPVKFGYKDFIPQFKAEKFDPDEWAELIQKSGAKYAGIAVVHHDGFALWNSKVTRWNSVNMGPHRDLYGDLVKAYRKKGLKIIATFHHIRTFNWFLPRGKKGIEEARANNYDLFDPQYSDFYWNQYTSDMDTFLEQWKNRVKEVVNNYQPDVIWFDGGKFQNKKSEAFVTSILSYYYNKGLEWKKSVEILNKLPTSKKFNFPKDFGVLTFEAGRDRPDSVSRPWIDDEKIGIDSWGYIEGLQYKSTKELLHGLIDRVSRGGGMLLSLSPKADGTIPNGQKKILLEMGKWLKLNGEAIYGCKKWKIFGEGDQEKLITRGTHKGWSFKNCDEKDIRFTVNGNNLYAIVLGWPVNGRILIKTLNKETKISNRGINSISLVGYNHKLQWEQNSEGLYITLPDKKPCNYAYTFRIEPKGKLILN